jgi:Carboxypeptidase regulatory-like domain
LLTPETTASTAPLAATAIAMSVLWIMSASAVMAQPPTPRSPANPVPIEVARIAPPPAAAILLNPFGPAPQAPKPATVGPAGFSGAVVDDGTGSAAASVTVGLYPAGSAVMAAEFETDSSGRFGPVHLPDGDYRLEALKTNYISVRKPVTVKAGALDTIVRMVRRGVVTGKVVDAKGQPVYGAVVMALPKRPVEGLLRILAAEAVTTTDAAGTYRLFGISSGEYAIAMTYGGASTVFTNLGTIPTPSRLGSGLDIYPTASRPDFIAIGSGTEVRGIDFKLPDSALFTITGTVDAPGPLSRFVIALTRDDQEGLQIATTTIDPGATFRFSGLPRGVYRLFASRVAVPANSVMQPNGTVTAVPAGAPRPPAPEPMFATARVELNSLSSDPVRLQAAPGLNARFSLASTLGCASAVNFVVIALPGWGSDNRRPGQLTADAPLQLTGLAPGRYIARATNPGAECYSPDFPIDLTAGSPEEPIVVKIGRAGAVHGTVQGVAGPGGELTVMLTPADGSPADTATPNSRGEFTFDKVPPGQYRLGVYGTGRDVARATSTTVVDIAPDATVEVALPAPAAH